MPVKHILAHPELGALSFSQPNFGIFVFAKDPPAGFEDQDCAMAIPEAHLDLFLRQAKNFGIEALEVKSVESDSTLNVVTYDELRENGFADLVPETPGLAIR